MMYAVWNDRGFSLRGTVARIWGARFRNPLGEISGIIVGWRDLVALELVDPWPCIRVEWRHIGGVSYRVFEPQDGEEEIFAQEIESLMGHVVRFRPTCIARGWLDVPDERWELVSAFPSEDAHSVSRGVYRSVNLRQGERIVARRGRSVSLRLWLERLRIARGRPWCRYPRRVAVTEEFAYVERGDRSSWRLPLSCLRSRSSRADAAVYTFGRRARLELPRQLGCTVEAELARRVALNAVIGGTLSWRMSVPMKSFDVVQPRPM